jgi:hypothetical protein
MVANIPAFRSLGGNSVKVKANNKVKTNLFIILNFNVKTDLTKDTTGPSFANQEVINYNMHSGFIVVELTFKL